MPSYTPLMDKTLKFFFGVHNRCCRTVDLSLRTLTLVFGDPRMNILDGRHESLQTVASADPLLQRRNTKIKDGPSVAAYFTDIKFLSRDGYGGADDQDLALLLFTCSEAIQSEYDVQTSHGNPHYHSWGCDVKVSGKQVRRQHGNFAVGTAAPKPDWLQALEQYNPWVLES